MVKFQPSSTAEMFLSRVTEREAGFAPDLRKLGFKPTNDGKFVSLRDNKSFFDFYFSSKMRSNQVRKGAMQEAVRAEILRKLRDDYGIVEVSIGSGGRTVLPTKPTGRHVTILSNPVSELREKREVIIFVGDSGACSGGAADSSVFSWRTVLEQDGLYKGSAVGLADHLKKYGQSKRSEPYEKDCFIDAGSTITAEALGKKDEPDPTPGLIILSPGQLVFSHFENKCMTTASWDARKRPDGNLQPYDIDETANRVPGHANSKMHIRTVFDSILDQLLHEEARVYIIAVGDSAEEVVQDLDMIVLHNPEGGLAKQLQCVAFAGPQIDSAIDSEALRNHLANYSRSWIESDQPFGALVNNPTLPPRSPTTEHAPDYFQNPGQDNSNHRETSNESDGSSQSVLEMQTSSPPGPAHAQVLDISYGPGEYKPHDRKASRASGDIFFTFGSEGDIIDRTNEPDTPPADDQAASFHEEIANYGEVADPDDKAPADEDVAEAEPEYDCVSASEASPSEVSDVSEESSEPLPHVISPTFSAGDCNGHLELIFPKVMDNILQFFFEDMEKEQARKERAEEYSLGD